MKFASEHGCRPSVNAALSLHGQSHYHWGFSNFSDSKIILDGLTFRAVASLNIVVIVGWFWPVSISEMKLRCTPDSKPNCSSLHPVASRSLCRNCPKAKAFGRFWRFAYGPECTHCTHGALFKGLQRPPVGFVQFIANLHSSPEINKRSGL